MKYWITFNEINVLLISTFLGGFINKSDDPNLNQSKYQAAHPQLVASAMTTKLAHEINSNLKIGCMLAAGSTYPNTCHPNVIYGNP